MRTRKNPAPLALGSASLARGAHVQNEVGAAAEVVAEQATAVRPRVRVKSRAGLGRRPQGAPWRGVGEGRLGRGAGWGRAPAPRPRPALGRPDPHTLAR